MSETNDELYVAVVIETTTVGQAGYCAYMRSRVRSANTTSRG